jgi:hypothetical protein
MPGKMPTVMARIGKRGQEDSEVERSFLQASRVDSSALGVSEAAGGEAGGLLGLMMHMSPEGAQS